MELNVGMLILQFLILTGVVSGVLIFFLKKHLFDSTQGAVNRLNRETEDVRAKQAELNEKIKQANEELAKRRGEADALVSKMKEDASEKAKEEREKIVKKAREDGEEIISKAQQTKDDMRKAMEKEMDLKAVDFTVIVMDEIFSEKAKKQFNATLIEDFIEGLKQVDMSMISEDVQVADVLTTEALVDNDQKSIQDIIKGKLNRDIKVNSVIDKEIVGGIVLKFGSLSLDGSLRNLIKEKGAEIKEKVERGVLELKVK